jgi:hypothetical protein
MDMTGQLNILSCLPSFWVGRVWLEGSYLEWCKVINSFVHYFFLWNSEIYNVIWSEC